MGGVVKNKKGSWGSGAKKEKKGEAVWVTTLARATSGIRRVTSDHLRGLPAF
jgi:hypothetical protein